MDLWGLFMFFFLAFIIMSCCGYCCSRKQRGAVLSAPVVVTSATHTVTQMPAGATTAYQTQAYSTPYPPQAAPVHMPMPMPASQPPAAGVHPNFAPYPTMSAASMNPPPYDVAVHGAGAGQQNSSIYTKQAPYNPNYQM